jgi:hypothetical protein
MLSAGQAPIGFVPFGGTGRGHPSFFFAYPSYFAASRIRPSRRPIVSRGQILLPEAHDVIVAKRANEQNAMETAAES